VASPIGRLPELATPSDSTSIFEVLNRVVLAKDGTTFIRRPYVYSVKFDHFAFFGRLECPCVHTMTLLIEYDLSKIINSVRYFLDAIEQWFVELKVLQFARLVQVMSLIIPVKLPNFMEDIVLYGPEDVLTLIVDFLRRTERYLRVVCHDDG